MNLPSLLAASRPKTLPAAVVPVWAGCVLSWKLTGTWDPWLAAWTATGALCIQIATNLFNDGIDARKGADTPRRTGPTRATASGAVSYRAVMVSGLFFVAAALACGSLLFRARGWPIAAIGIPSLWFAYGYTGGPFPLAYRGLGELFVVIFFGFVAVTGTVFIQTGLWPREALLLGGQVGLLSAVLISINNFRDREEDASTGKRTMAVRLGPRGAAALIWLEIKVALFASLLWLPLGHPMLAFAAAPLLPMGTRILWGIFTSPPGPACNRLLALAGIQLLLFAAALHLAAVSSA